MVTTGRRGVRGTPDRPWRSWRDLAVVGRRRPLRTAGTCGTGGDGSAWFPAGDHGRVPWRPGGVRCPWRGVVPPVDVVPLDASRLPAGVGVQSERALRSVSGA
ncbi:hypothetical protein AWW66_09650 [Micromonospora rosaria]|uniref:Uncharacterized protein n=1 Tax=Micromonospora rosaria TaxID=47874 RepID=A0A136PUQ3_9ACTN|nr:hypothetical protein AWW66_09650 [Micromonospora rosaria]